MKVMKQRNSESRAISIFNELLGFDIQSSFWSLKYFMIYANGFFEV